MFLCLLQANEESKKQESKYAELAHQLEEEKRKALEAAASASTAEELQAVKRELNVYKKKAESLSRELKNALAGGAGGPRQAPLTPTEDAQYKAKVEELQKKIEVLIKVVMIMMMGRAIIMITIIKIRIIIIKIGGRHGQKRLKYGYSTSILLKTIQSYFPPPLFLCVNLFFLTAPDRCSTKKRLPTKMLWSTPCRT